jgi:phosphotransferase system enzyme I (PtsI)
MVLTGNPVSPGAAAGPVFVYRPFPVEVEEKFLADGADAEEEFSRYTAAKTAAEKEIRTLQSRLEKHPDKAKIFTAHLDILEDPVINEEIEGAIKSERMAGEWAVRKIYDSFIGMIKKARDPVIAERFVDFEDICRRLLRIWAGAENSSLDLLDEKMIIAARDLFPSDTASLDRDKVLAIITEEGGSTSHSAIIARGYGIPAVLGISSLMDTLEGMEKPLVSAAVDAETGKVFLNPDDALIKEFNQKRERFLQDRELALRYLETEPFTKDGVPLELGLNIGSAGEEELKGAAYTDFCGLFRTEFLFMGRDGLPSEEEQYAVYRRVLEKYGTRPVTLRTLDIGGDKPLSSIALPREENPFLGNRALRLCFTHPEIFKTQLRAALRAAVHGNLWIMFPMVGSIEDITRAQSYVEEVKVELEKEKVPYGKAFKTGIMIEIPAIALIAEAAARRVDFASIGSNDLCQYLCAADRVNPAMAEYYQNFHPALFRLIRDTVRAFNRAGKPISLCGELGGDPAALPLLVGLGLRKLSMGFASLAPVKRALLTLTIKEAEGLAEKVLAMESAGEIKTLVNTRSKDV